MQSQHRWCNGSVLCWHQKKEERTFGSCPHHEQSIMYCKAIFQSSQCMAEPVQERDEKIFEKTSQPKPAPNQPPTRTRKKPQRLQVGLASQAIWEWMHWPNVSTARCIFGALALPRFPACYPSVELAVNTQAVLLLPAPFVCLFFSSAWQWLLSEAETSRFVSFFLSFFPIVPWPITPISYCCGAPCTRRRPQMSLHECGDRLLGWAANIFFGASRPPGRLAPNEMFAAPDGSAVMLPSQVS